MSLSAKKFFILSATLVVFAIPGSSFAQSWGTGVDGATGASEFSVSGVPGTIDGFMSDPSTLNHVDANAILMSEATFEDTSGIATPLLMSSSDAANRGDANAWAVNAYTYSGPTKYSRLR